MADFKKRDISGTYYNLIPSRFPTINLFERLDADKQNEIAEIESLTNPRAKEKARIMNGQKIIDTEIPHLQNFNHAPFTYYNPEGSTFYGSNHAALELTDERDLAILRSIARRETFLNHTRQKPMALEMRELCRTVTGSFADLSDLAPSLAKEARLKIGQEVDDQGFDGLMFRSAVRPNTTCIAVRKNGVLGKVDQGDHFKFFWDGNRIVRVYSFRKSAVLDLEELSILAA